MVVMDATTLMLLFHPTADGPIDETTGERVTNCKERVELLVQNLSEVGIKIMVPTPVLSEILVTVKADKARILSEIAHSYAFKIQSFDTLAAVELSELVDPDLQSQRELTAGETKAKLKFDLQIIAMAKVAGVKTIYSDDRGLGKKALANGIAVVRTCELPLPPEPPQAELPYPDTPRT